MCKFKPLFQFLLLPVLVLVATSTAQAQTNSIVNPGFDTDLSGWTKAFGRPGEWSPDDAMGNGSSGSALLGNEGTGDGIVPFVLLQCFELDGAEMVEWGGDLLIPGGQPSGTQAYIHLEPFDNSTCSGAPIDGLISTSSSQVGDWVNRSRTITTPAQTQSVRVALGVLKPVGEMADAEAYFDNIFLYLPEGGGGDDFQVNPSISASWYNPAESGHGIMIHLLDANTAWMCWFTFTLTGEPAWVCALGDVMEDMLVFEDVFAVEGGAFPPNFDPGMIVEVPWGSITVTFTGCDEGTMVWTTNAPGFTSGMMPLARLTSLWGASCP